MALVVGFVIFLIVGPPLGVVTLVGGALIEVGELYLWMRYLGRFRVRGGVEGLVGERGWVLAECRPEGRVRVRGEIWRASCPEPGGLAEGAEVEVTAVDGLRVTVRALERGGPGSEGSLSGLPG